MKKTKTLLAMILVLVLLISIDTCAFAAGAKYTSTKDYVEAMADLDGADCSIEKDTADIGGSTYEVVTVDYEGELSEYKQHFNVGFAEDPDSEDTVEILMSMNIMEIDEEDLADVLIEVNEFNAKTTSVKLYVDLADNTVVGEFYLLTGKDSATDIALYATGLFIGFTDQIYDALGDYAV